jgi:riboflavin kinase/FMN adenylyltransferase
VRLLRTLSDFPPDLRGGAVSIGNFDGVHAGHAEIVRRLNARAASLGGPSLVFSFDPHPVRLLRPDSAPPPLTWADRKAELLARLGISALIAYPTDMEMLRLTPDAFFRRIVVETLDARAMVEGANFHFGKNRAGDVTTLQGLAGAARIDVEIVEPLMMDGEPVSSSRVRRLIAEGRVQEALRLLTQPYRLRGMVTHGIGRGHSLGFPTANLSAIDTLLPAEGVYACRVMIDDRAWPAAANLGSNPTFGEDAVKLEVHVIGFQGSLYGRILEVDFLERIRGVETFPNADALRARLQRDVEYATRVVKE